jgi:hypothetical protein
MKERNCDFMENFPPTFFSKLGEAMKLIEQYERHLMMNSGDAGAEENALPEKLRL